MNVEIGIVAAQFLFRENLFEFSALFFAVQLYSPCLCQKYTQRAIQKEKTPEHRAILYWIESGCRREASRRCYWRKFTLHSEEIGGKGEGGYSCQLLAYLSAWMARIYSTPQCICMVWVFGTNKQLQNCVYSSSFYASSTNLQSQSKAFRKKLYEEMRERWRCLITQYI